MISYPQFLPTEADNPNHISETWYLIQCGATFQLQQKASVYMKIIFHSSWPFPQPSGSTGHQYTSPCQVQRHLSSMPSRWGFWVACENSYTWAASTWHDYAGNAGTWSDAFAGAAAARRMSTRCPINISYQGTVFLALFSILNVIKCLLITGEARWIWDCKKQLHFGQAWPW